MLELLAVELELVGSHAEVRSARVVHPDQRHVAALSVCLELEDCGQVERGQHLGGPVGREHEVVVQLPVHPKKVEPPPGVALRVTTVPPVRPVRSSRKASFHSSPMPRPLMAMPSLAARRASIRQSASASSGLTPVRLALVFAWVAMLVAALAGLDRIKAAYSHAVAAGYRFFSYGDACLIERSR